MIYQLLIESLQLHILPQYKVSNCDKHRPDLPKLIFLLIFFLQVYEIVRISVQAIFDAQKTTLAVSSL